MSGNRNSARSGWIDNYAGGLDPFSVHHPGTTESPLTPSKDKQGGYDQDQMGTGDGML